MLKKIFLIFLIFFSTTVFALEYVPYLQKGALIKVYAKTPVSTDSLEEGSIVYFISPVDLWILEQKAIEKGDIFYGYVDMLKMPTKGVNAALSIKIKKIVKLNGEIKDIEGSLIFPNGSKVLGGTLTNPESYNTAVHPRKVYGNIWGGTLQYVPSGEYQFGSHVGVQSRDSLLIRLDEDYQI